MSHNFFVPQLPVLDKLVQYGNQFTGWEKIAFVCVQHLLPTTVSLFSALISLGVRPDNIYVLGKHYSTNDLAKEALVFKFGLNLIENRTQKRLGSFSEFFYEDIMELWHFFLKDILTKSIESVIVIDEGGHCLGTVPAELVHSHKVFGIEQTTAGLLRPNVVEHLQKLCIPLINVAHCAAKKWLEPFVISRSIIKRVSDLISTANEDLSFGVIGCGAIGKAVVGRLLELGYQPSVYDILSNERTKSENYLWRDSINELISSADVVLGCTGQDVSKDIQIYASTREDKSLISCSSEDIEYNSLLRSVQESRFCSLAISPPLEDVVYETQYSRHLRIHRGGFPINFNNLSEVEPISEIQLTRGLVLGGTLQAVSLQSSLRKRDHSIYALDSGLQKAIANIWAICQTKTGDLHRLLWQFEDESWINKHSKGTKGFPLNMVY